MARGIMAKADVALRQAHEALDHGDWSDAVRRSQEAVELALKALLRFLSIEPPKWHDPSDILRAEAERLPPPVRDRLDEITAASAALRKDRERSMYGDEEEGLPPQALFDERAGRTAAERAEAVVSLVRGVVPH